MIETLIFICGCVGGLVLGLIVGHRWGYDAGYKAAPIPFSPSFSPRMHVPIPVVESPMRKYQFSLRLSMPPAPEDRIRQSTWAAEHICTSIARKMLADRTIRPVILEEHSGFSGDTWEIGASLFAVPDPSLEEYPNLVFFELPLTPD
ncbi:hypothetical protein [Muribaculum intestinale]|uniref:hypothetical protein n=1 Tax=Muribaculum intestinale TaxID=1796646 RepID=UPI0025A9E964|nr:hypothetical protein [Muribaculum intestinale]